MAHWIELTTTHRAEYTSTPSDRSGEAPRRKVADFPDRKTLFLVTDMRAMRDSLLEIKPGPKEPLYEILGTSFSSLGVDYRVMEPKEEIVRLVKKTLNVVGHPMMKSDPILRPVQQRIDMARKIAAALQISYGHAEEALATFMEQYTHARVMIDDALAGGKSKERKIHPLNDCVEQIRFKYDATSHPKFRAAMDAAEVELNLMCQPSGEEV